MVNVSKDGSLTSMKGAGIGQVWFARLVLQYELHSFLRARHAVFVRIAIKQYKFRYMDEMHLTHVLYHLQIIPAGKPQLYSCGFVYKQTTSAYT